MIAPDRWKLRKAVKLVNKVLTSLKLEKRPDKTFIGRASKGFSFLGYHIPPWGIMVARGTVNKMHEHIARLYEQGAGPSGIGQYVRRWVRWVLAGLSGVSSQLLNDLINSNFGFIINNPQSSSSSRVE